MSMVRNAMSVALLLFTVTGVAAQADNPLTTGCSAAAQRTEAEGGGVGTVNMATRKTDAESTGAGTADHSAQMAAAVPCK